MSLKNELSDLRISRLEIGTEILKAMDERGEFPLSDMFKVTDKMMQYFYEMGFEDKLQDEKSVWLPDNDYWRHNFKTLRALLREDHNRYLEFIRTEGKQGFVGVWKFCDKLNYVKKLKDDHIDISTRTETYNDKLDDGIDKWKIQLPNIKPVPALT